MNDPRMHSPRNVLGGPLAICCESPPTGFYRTGECMTGPHDSGSHVICAKLTDAFLQFTLSRGNDLITPAPQFQFPGLREGSRWCLCALRWREALIASVAPPVYLVATHERALDFVTLDDLKQHALDLQ